MLIQEVGREIIERAEWVAIATAGPEGPHLVATWGDYVRALGIQVSCRHYITQRSHRGAGMDNEVLDEQFKPQRVGPVCCRERLGGLIKEYYREAAKYTPIALWYHSRSSIWPASSLVVHNRLTVTRSSLEVRNNRSASSGTPTRGRAIYLLIVCNQGLG